MALLFRWLMAAFVILASVTVAGLALAYYVASRSLPDYDRTWRIEGPEAEIEIVRDSHAVPHILSTTDADAFFGLGFVHAQDRLWQMTLMRRTAQGRLSELFGPETLEIDELMRALDLHALSARAVAFQTPETRAALDAYSRGVNAWLRLVQEQALGRGAPEFFLFDRRIAPWSPADSIAILKLMALRLTDKAEMETLRAGLSLRLAPERLRDILPEAPNAPVMALPDFAALFEGAPAPDWRMAGRSPLDPVGPAGLAGASNAFAAMADRTAGGATLLATDPHLMLSAPSIWMLARMDLAEGPVIGATIPGVPVVMLGRNATLGWGITSSYLDDQDVYIERLNPEDGDEYLTPEGFRRFEERRTSIGVRDAPDEERVLRATRHGPVIPGSRFNADAVTPPGHVASLAWTGLIEDDRTIGAAIALMRADTIREARAAARGFVAPSLMLTLVDRDSIALQMIGAAPARQPGHTSQGRIPAPGWLAVNDWRGMRPFAENPWVMNPESGIVANTNNRITDAAFPDHLSFDWGDSYRIDRAERLLNAREFHTLESFIEIQTDEVSEAARTLLPLIARDLWYSGRHGRRGEGDARGGAGPAGRLERRDVRTRARAPDLRGLGARAQTPAGGRRARLDGRRGAGAGSGVSRTGVPERRRRGRVVRRGADERDGDLRRDGAARARRRAGGTFGALRPAAGKLALGRRAPGGASSRDPRAGARARSSGQHPPEHRRRGPDADARADDRSRARSLRERPCGRVPGGA